jgi:hypothetical protein
MDSYCIEKDTLASRTRITLSAAEFREIVGAIDSLLRVLDVEEAYDILISNYADYEKAVASILIEEEVRGRLKGDAFNRDRRRMSRMTANLLSSVLLFQEVCDKAVKDLFGRSALAELRQEKERIAAGSFHYRVMEALRNHSQHEHFAVTGLSYGTNWLEHGDEIKATRVHTFKPGLRVKVLRRFARWKDIVAEYDAMQAADPKLPETMDLTYYLRSYVASIGDVLLYVRRLLDDQKSVEGWAEIIQRRVAEFTEADRNPVEMGIVAKHLRNDELVKEHHLGGALAEIVARLRKDNRKLVNLHRIQFRL